METFFSFNVYIVFFVLIKQHFSTVRRKRSPLTESRNNYLKTSFCNKKGLYPRNKRRMQKKKKKIVVTALYLTKEADFTDSVVFNLSYTGNIVETALVEYNIHKRKGLILPGKADVVVSGVAIGVLLVKGNQLKSGIQGKTAFDTEQINSLDLLLLSHSIKMVTIHTSHQ